MKLCDNVISFEFIRDKIVYDGKAKENLCTLKPMLEKRIISKVMADKIAGSGLTFNALKLAFSRDSVNGIKYLFSEESNSKCRVTKSKNKRPMRACIASLPIFTCGTVKTIKIVT